MEGALPSVLRATLVAAALTACAAGCSIDTDPLAGLARDGGPHRDGGPRDGASTDGFVPPVDAGPLCDTLGGPRVVAVLDGDDFGSDDAERDGVEMQRPGQLALALSPYRYGGILATGYEGALLGDPPSFDDVAGETPTGRAVLATVDASWSGSESMPGLLLADADQYTAVASGEIFLSNGAHSIRLEADDVGLVEIGDTGTMVRAVAPDASSAGTASFAVPSSGWYPIRLAWADTGGDSEVLLALTLPDGSTEVVGPGRLRTDVSGVPGRDLLGWDTRDPGDTPDGERIDEGDTVEDFATVPFPQGVGITDSSDFTARWVGRHVFRLGDTLSAAADDAYELWVDGVFLGSGSSADYTPVVPPGTHDVVFELDQGGGGLSASLERAGEPFAVDDLRPRTRFGGRPFGAGDDVDTNVDGGRSSTVTLTVDSPDEPVAAVEVSVVVSTPDPGSVQLSVEAPDGETFDFDLDTRMRTTFLTDQRVFRAVIAPEDIAGASGDWVLTLDNTGSDRAVWQRAGVLVHVRGDSSPYETSGTFTSAVLDLGVETALDRVQSITDRPFGTTVGMELRAARSEGDLEASAWTAVDASGSLPAELRGRYAQLRVALEGPGYDTPRVTDLRVVGRPCTDCEAGTAGCPLELSGLIARYTFEENGGRRIRDVSGVGAPLDLFVVDTDAVTWSADGLSIDSPTIVTSIFPGQKIIEACADSRELAVEAWIRPANTTQDGPARIVTLSVDANHRDFTFGQDAGDYILRLRSTDTDDNGAPETTVPAVETGWQHVVWSKDSADMLRMWVDGRHQITEERTGDYSGWEPYTFALANEIEDPRPWLGEFRQVSVYCRALTPPDVAAHFAAGMDP